MSSKGERTHDSIATKQMTMDERIPGFTSSLDIAACLLQGMEDSHLLMAVIDFGGNVAHWNSALARLTGISKEAILGKPLLRFLEERGYPALGRVAETVAKEGIGQRADITLPSKEGKQVEACFSILPASGSPKHGYAVVVLGNDITLLRTLENQVMHAGRLATVGQIAAGVAHEINNPLTSVQMCADAVLRKATLALEGRVVNAFESSDVARLKRIQEGADRIRLVAKDLVSYARPAAREVEVLPFNDVIEHALSFCEPVLASVKATLTCELSPDIPPVHGVRDHIMQVVINLVSNGAYALRESGGGITVRTAFLEDRVELSVADTGEGIRAEDQDRVFEPFFTTKPAGQGTGLGLPVVRNIVDAHGGQIRFSSKVGKGTIFVVTFPLESVSFAR